MHAGRFDLRFNVVRILWTLLVIFHGRLGKLESHIIEVFFLLPQLWTVLHHLQLIQNSFGNTLEHSMMVLVLGDNFEFFLPFLNGINRQLFFMLMIVPILKLKFVKRMRYAMNLFIMYSILLQGLASFPQLCPFLKKTRTWTRLPIVRPCETSQR